MPRHDRDRPPATMTPPRPRAVGGRGEPGGHDGGMQGRYRVCFVCSGNICRSPMAEAVLRAQLAAGAIDDLVEVDSAGTMAEVGLGMDRRAVRALRSRGYEPHAHLARQFEAPWLASRDLVVALDRTHDRWLRHLAAEHAGGARLAMLRGFATEAQPAGGREDLDVPDPYYGGQEGFEANLDVIERHCAAIALEVAAAAGRPLDERALSSPGSPSSC